MQYFGYEQLSPKSGSRGRIQNKGDAGLLLCDNMWKLFSVSSLREAVRDTENLEALSYKEIKGERVAIATCWVLRLTGVVG